MQITTTQFYKAYFFFAALLLALFPLHLHAESEKRPDIFIAPLAEVIGFSKEGASFGGGLAIGAEENGKAMGLRFLYAVDSESVSIMELNVLMRFYFFEKDTHNGLFVQLNGGCTLFSHERDNGLPEEDAGGFSVGVTAGWRFPFSKYFFVEPYIRAGYPYIAGLGVAAGFIF